MTHHIEIEMSLEPEWFRNENLRDSEYEELRSLHIRDQIRRQQTC